MIAERSTRIGPKTALAMIAAAWAAPAHAQDVDFFGADAWSLSADLRIVAADGEQSWIDHEFGKLRFGDEFGPRLGSMDVVWKPRMGWAVSATVAATVQQQGDQLRAG